MKSIFIKGIEEECEIVANGKYGASFSFSIFDSENNTYLQENVSMNELKEPITSLSTTTQNNQLKSDTNLELNDTTGIVNGDRLKIGNYIYIIESVLGDFITINGLLESLSAGTDVTRVGNLGIYKANITINDVGTYLLIGSDTIFGLKVIESITVKEKSLEMMVKDIKNLEYAILGA